MEYQIDFLPIGEKSCGDAIAVRFGELSSGDPTKQTVVLIDGGFRADSQKIIDHLTDHYGTGAIDLAVSTHADNDHSGGLIGVLESFPVSNLWMHLPWEHSDDLLAYRQEEFAETSLTNKIQRSMRASNDLALAADAAGLQPLEPFMGRQFSTDYGTLTVLGPTAEYYQQLLDEIINSSTGSTAPQQAALSTLTRAIQAAASIAESHTIETLSDRGETSPSNNTSAILLLEVKNGPKVLFTGDAGKPALEIAYLAYEYLGHKPGDLKLVQVPHHASRRNVGPTILNKFLGARTDNPDQRRGNAVASVGADCRKDGHPKRVTTNAFKRRGYPVTQTKGAGVMFGMDRANWGPVDALPLFTSVEADD